MIIIYDHIIIINDHVKIILSYNNSSNNNKNQNIWSYDNNNKWSYNNNIIIVEKK